jgi:hypothetical protein
MNAAILECSSAVRKSIATKGACLTTWRRSTFPMGGSVRSRIRSITPGNGFWFISRVIARVGSATSSLVSRGASPKMTATTRLGWNTKSNPSLLKKKCEWQRKDGQDVSKGAGGRRPAPFLMGHWPVPSMARLSLTSSPRFVQFQVQLRRCRAPAFGQDLTQNWGLV